MAGANVRRQGVGSPDLATASANSVRLIMTSFPVRERPSVHEQKIIRVEQRPGDRFEAVSVGKIDEFRGLFRGRLALPGPLHHPHDPGLDRVGGGIGGGRFGAAGEMPGVMEHEAIVGEDERLERGG